jgi:hypothetical protein
VIFYRVAHKSIGNEYGIPKGPYALSIDIKDRIDDDFCDLTEEESALQDLMGEFFNNGFPTDRHPMPHSDGLDDIIYDEDYYYGFRSIAQARKWFKDAGKALANAGFALYVYRVNERVDGNSQSATPLAGKRPIKVLDTSILD